MHHPLPEEYQTQDAHGHKSTVTSQQQEESMLPGIQLTTEKINYGLHARLKVPIIARSSEKNSLPKYLLAIHSTLLKDQALIIQRKFAKLAVQILKHVPNEEKN
jgi:hypothetical protein